VLFIEIFFAVEKVEDSVPNGSVVEFSTAEWGTGHESRPETPVQFGVCFRCSADMTTYVEMLIQRC
jgi:hypothetical protein